MPASPSAAEPEPEPEQAPAEERKNEKKGKKEPEEPPPKPPSEQFLATQKVGAEGSVAYERFGQPLLLALAHGRNELHVVAGPEATGMKKKLAQAKELAGGLGEEQQISWLRADSWVPCCDCSRRVGTGDSPRRSPRGSPRGRAAGGAAVTITSRVLRAADHRIAAFAVDPKADAAYTGSELGEVIGWDLSAGSKTWAVPPFKPGPGVRPTAVTGMSVSRGVLSVTTLDGSVRGLAPSSGEKLWTMSGEAIGAISVGGGVIYTGSYDKTVRATAADTGEEKWKHTGHTEAIRALARDKSKLYTGSWDCTVRALALKDGAEKWAFTGHERPVTALAVSGSTLFTASYDRTVRALRVASGTEMWVFPGHKGPVFALAVCGGVVFSGGEDMRVFGIDADSGAKVWRYKDHTRRIKAVSVCRDDEDVTNSMVYTISDDDTVRVLKAEDGEEQWVSRWGWMAKPSAVGYKNSAEEDAATMAKALSPGTLWDARLGRSVPSPSMVMKDLSPLKDLPGSLPPLKGSFGSPVALKAHDMDRDGEGAGSRPVSAGSLEAPP